MFTLFVIAAAFVFSLKLVCKSHYILLVVAMGQRRLEKVKEGAEKGVNSLAQDSLAQVSMTNDIYFTDFMR